MTQQEQLIEFCNLIDVNEIVSYLREQRNCVVPTIYTENDVYDIAGELGQSLNTFEVLGVVHQANQILTNATQNHTEGLLANLVKKIDG
jgi:hypothetical protein